ncbi:MAG: hypothetical protein QOE27_1559 [Solirubrobacteraceae bacterium]|nr:hypothetical protein [Solirubrobacteraceae bacterium]MEA2354253.1 hypothetical protein [Solirubrobacteraceae bacterium]
MDFDELVAALTALEGRTVRLQLGTPGHETVALEATGPLHAQDAGDGWAVFTLEGIAVRMNLGAGEFAEAESSLDGSGSLRFLSSGVEFYVVPENRR